MKVYVIRHGRTRWNDERRLQGWEGVELTEEGVSQVKALAEKLKGLSPDAVYSSDLERAVQSARLLIQEAGWQAPHIVDPRLREIYHGSWEGRRASEFKDLAEKTGPGRFGPPDGEGFKKLASRLYQFLEDLRSTGYREVVIVGHQVTNAALKLLLLGYPPDHIVFDYLGHAMLSSLALLAQTGYNICQLMQTNSQAEEFEL